MLEDKWVIIDGDNASVIQLLQDALQRKAWLVSFHMGEELDFLQ